MTRCKPISVEWKGRKRWPSRWPMKRRQIPTTLYFLKKDTIFHEVNLCFSNWLCNCFIIEWFYQTRISLKCCILIYFIVPRQRYDKMAYSWNRLQNLCKSWMLQVINLIFRLPYNGLLTFSWQQMAEKEQLHGMGRASRGASDGVNSCLHIFCGKCLTRQSSILKMTINVTK